MSAFKRAKAFVRLLQDADQIIVSFFLDGAMKHAEAKIYPVSGNIRTAESPITQSPILVSKADEIPLVSVEELDMGEPYGDEPSTIKLRNGKLICAYKRVPISFSSFDLDCPPVLTIIDETDTSIFAEPLPDTDPQELYDFALTLAKFTKKTVRYPTEHGVAEIVVTPASFYSSLTGEETR